MSKRAEKARLARASVIKLCWPLSFALTLLFCTVLLVCFLQTVPSHTMANKLRSSRQCDKEDSFCQVQHIYATLRSFFQMWAVAKSSAQRHRFVGIAVRLTIGPFTSLVTYTAVMFLAVYLPTCGEVESNPGPGEREDYPWCQPPTRHGITTDIITRQAACSAGERSANQTSTTALTPLPELRDPAVHSHDWKYTSCSCQMTP